MPVALLMALAASLGLHIAALFLPEVDLAPEPEAPPLMAELRPAPPPQKVVQAEAPKHVVAKPAQPKPRKRPPSSDAVAPAQPVLSVPAEPANDAAAAAASEVPASEQASSSAPGDGNANGENRDAVLPHDEAPAPAIVRRLPDRGLIHYRVDRGDSNFAIGEARQDWEIVDGHYRLRSVVETTGLIWLLRSLRIEMESRGRVTDEGLRPDTFTIRRDGGEPREKATFDWDAMQVSVADREPQPLDRGAQDLLSFNYQLSFMAHPELGTVLHLATGKKYDTYELQVVGDEEITVPAGTMRTLHLRAPGNNTTELWLAYDYLLLPVKIRHVDAKGDSLVQVATKIQVSPD